MTTGLNDDVMLVQPNMVNLTAIDFSKWNEWDGLLSERNEWDGLWPETIKMKCDQWNWWCDKRGTEVEWLGHDVL